MKLFNKGAVRLIGRAKRHPKTPPSWLNASLHCRYLRGFSRNKTKLMRYDTLINSLLQKASSQVEICDAVFARWRRVIEWLPEEPVAVVEWIESIPFKKTRASVKAVIAYERIYTEHLSEGGATLPSNFADLSEMLMSLDTLTSLQEGDKLVTR